jgi:hypothetical protein
MLEVCRYTSAIILEDRYTVRICWLVESRLSFGPVNGRVCGEGEGAHVGAGSNRFTTIFYSQQDCVQGLRWRWAPLGQGA